MASSRSKPDSSDQPYTRSETAFNADLREVLRAQGLGVIHVRETDTPGAFDLLVTETHERTRHGVSQLIPHRFMWIELKVMDEDLRPSQRTFARSHREAGELLMVIRLRADHAVQVLESTAARELLWTGDFTKFGWAGWLRRQLDDHYADL